MSAEVMIRPEGEFQFPPKEVDLHGVFDEERQVEYVGKATLQGDGKYVCLAKIGGALCFVEVTLTPKRLVP